MPLPHRRPLFALAVVFMGFVTAAAFYVCTRGFTRSWRRLMTREFEQRGVELSMQRLTLDPFRGLVARDVKLYDAKNRRRVLAVIDEMLLGVNYLQAFRGGPFLDWVDLHETRVALPWQNDRDGSPIELTGLNARIFLPPQQLYLARAEADLLGIHCYATGRLLNPQALRMDPAHPSDPRQPLVKLLSSLRYEDEAPVLSLEFTGDLQHPESFAWEARLRAGKIRRRNYLLTSLAATGTYRNGLLEVPQLLATDAHGQLRAAGTLEDSSGHLSARLESSLALAELASAFGWALPAERLTLLSPPTLDLTVAGPVRQPEEWKVFGQVSCGRFLYGPVTFQSLTAGLSWTAGSWSLRELRLRHASGQLEGDFLQRPEGFQGELHGRINPRELSPALAQPLTPWLDRFDFLDAPMISLQLTGPQTSLPTLRAEGELRCGRCTYEGRPAHHLTAQVRYGGEVLTLFPFQLGTGEREKTELRLDLRTQKVEMRPLRDPEERTTRADAPGAEPASTARR